MVWPLLACLRDYCANCSLAGISYIANNKLHFSERIFWLFCVIWSAYGSYKLISTFKRDFELFAVSIVFESLTPYDKIYFPSVAVCETMEKDGTTPPVEEFIKNNSEHWFPNVVEDNHAAATMRLVSQVAIEVFVINKEDIPYANLAGITVKVATPGKHTDFRISLQEMINDPDVLEVIPKYRGCRFPHEVTPHSSFRAYSFSACIVDCIRLLQMRYCNCTMYNLMPIPKRDMPDCDYNGYLCLEKETKATPDIKSLLPWPENNETCDCLPSCVEHDLRAVMEYSPSNRKGVNNRSIAISLSDRPTERYRRQALRTRLDVVVTIGGILGLFLGASILSLIEFIYYFTWRLYNNIRMYRSSSHGRNRAEIKVNQRAVKY